MDDSKLKGSKLDVEPLDLSGVLGFYSKGVVRRWFILTKDLRDSTLFCEKSVTEVQYLTLEKIPNQMDRLAFFEKEFKKKEN